MRKKETDDMFHARIKFIDDFNATIETHQRKCEEKLIVRDYIKNGFKIKEIRDIVDNEYIDSILAVELAVKWLAKVREMGNLRDLLEILCRSHASNKFTKEAVYYAIKAYKESKPLWHVIRMYAGNIVLDYADDDQYEEIIKIARNDYHQDLDVDGYFNSVERGFFVEVLAKMKKHPEVVGELIKLLNDEEVRWHVIKSLGSQKDPKALPHLRKFLNHKSTDIRKYTASAIAKIEKAQEKMKVKNN